MTEHVAVLAQNSTWANIVKYQHVLKDLSEMRAGRRGTIYTYLYIIDNCIEFHSKF